MPGSQTATMASYGRLAHLARMKFVREFPAFRQLTELV